MSSKKEFIKKDRFDSLEQAAEKITDSKKTSRKKKDTPVVSRFSQMEDIASDKNALVELPLSQLFPAPKEWNFYEILPPDKMLELMESILERGLLHPIIVWKQKSGYMILSGHNRKQAFETLYEKTQDQKYSKITAIIKGEDEITPDMAREIIIDTNWIQRQLSTMEKARSISEKYISLGRKRHSGDGMKNRDIVAEDYGISGRMVQNYLSLTELIPEMEHMLRENHLSIKNAVSIARMKVDIQRWLYENFTKEELASPKVNEIRKNMSKKQIQTLLEADKDYVKVNLTIKRELKDDFLAMAKEWIASRKAQ